MDALKHRGLIILIWLLGILLMATLLVPAITDSTAHSWGSHAKSDGRNIYTTVLNDAINDRLVRFPSDQKTTTDFFKDLAGVGQSNTNINILKAGPEFVLGPGMYTPAPNWESLTAEHHGWQVATGQSSSTPAGTAFMVSKNWIPLTIPVGSSKILSKNYANHRNLLDLDEDIKVIVIQHGGAAKTVRVGRDPLSFVNGHVPVKLLPE